MAMGAEPANSMARRRALLTTRERELLASDDEDELEYRYQAASRIRNKIQDELPRDVAILDEHHPQLLRELRGVVCEDVDLDTRERIKELEARLEAVKAQLDEEEQREGEDR